MSKDFLDDPRFIERGAGAPLLDFQHLMRHRVREVLLVSSLYDLYLFEEEGRLYELIRDEYLGLHLSHAPELTRVSRGAEALELLQGNHRFDLVITTPHVEDMTSLKLARTLRDAELDVPVVLLAYDNRELADMLTHGDVSVFDRIFVWQGDFRLLIAIIKDLEDRINAEYDTRELGVQCILLVEDDLRQYSWFLPLLYTETLKQSKRLITEGVNLSHRSLRMRGRPKILLCLDWEEAWERFEAYRDSILGVITDVAFPRGGEQDAEAGLELARKIRSQVFDVPIVLQSAGGDYSAAAEELGATFISKRSATMLADFRRCLTDHFSFGDFVFRTPDGTEVGRAVDLASLERELIRVPDESVRYHAERNHFSNWLKARTEFALAARLRPRRVSDYASTAEMRADLLRHLRENRRIRQQGLLSEFSSESFDPAVSFARIGGGSVGGKARGLAFVNMLLHGSGARESQTGVEIEVPAGIVIGTEVFDAFLGQNHLREFALACDDDEELARRFLDANQFPKDAIAKLRAFLALCREPLAVRSSSLLEDSQYHPFAGVYLTCMIPNEGDDEKRLQELLATIRRVYASTFFRAARDYMKVTSFGIEDEKMAVIVHRMVGARHGERFYPDISGVTRSYNFYPIAPQTPNDGITSVALGLGKLIVEGGVVARFCPKYPGHLVQLASPAAALRNSQTFFYALDMHAQPLEIRSAAGDCVVACRLEDAERDGTLAPLASTWSHQNDALYDGVGREGTPVVTFAPILRGKTFPLPEICDLLARLSSWG
ncbi:MAG: histidine kinase, partial [Acidobacteria bacterium]|nr:histidine kinase [Acidobacteriota bacterium]